MNFNWYYIFNALDFESAGLVQRTYSLILDGIGEKDILVTKGNYLGITYEGVFLPYDLAGIGQFEFEGFAIAKHENGNVFLGIEVDEN